MEPARRASSSAARSCSSGFLCTTDADNNQIASFYAGAMNEARHIDLDAILRSEHDVDIVLICPDDPDAMLRHTQACRDRAVPFAADPA
jgi:adenosine kinase